ncbi:hypothetical protein [Sphingomonas sp. 3-13AW]|uniref:hypothetical protein n=1 Tax=Sphingomonas sp. 3-13AW TaxID=3050450 RepID=UPI003BB7C647
MSDRDRSPHPDSDPAADTDTRTDIEQAVQARADDVERLGTDVGSTSPLDPPGEFDGTAGTGGVVKNQDLNQQ